MSSSMDTDVVSVEIDDEGPYLRSSDGRVTPLRTPTGIDPKVFRRVLATVDMCYRKMGRMPSVHDAFKEWGRIPKKTYGLVFSTPEFKDALVLRGITVDDNTGLTEEQGIALIALSDPTETRTTKGVLQGLGIPMGKYQAWMRNPLFSRELHRRAEENLKNSQATAINKLTANVEKGDQRAIEFSLGMTGRYSPNQAAVADAMEVVYATLEAVQRHVSADTMTAIVKEVRAKAVGFDMMNREITDG